MIFLTWLQLYSILTFISSALFISLNLALRLNYWNIKLFDLKRFMNCSSITYKFVIFILIISRTYATLHFSVMQEVAILSGVILFAFNYIRFIFVAGVLPETYIIYSLVFLIYFLGFINGIFRLCVVVGDNIDSNPKNNILLNLEDSIVFTWDSWTNIFRRGSSNVEQHTVQNPLPNPVGNSKLGRVGIIAGVLMLPVVAYSTYELYLSRKAAQDNAKAALDSAKAAQEQAKAMQQRTDIKALKHKLLSPETYRNRYPETPEIHSSSDNRISKDNSKTILQKQ